MAFPGEEGKWGHGDINAARIMLFQNCVCVSLGGFHAPRLALTHHPSAEATGPGSQVRSRSGTYTPPPLRRDNSSFESISLTYLILYRKSHPYSPWENRIFFSPPFLDYSRFAMLHNVYA